MIPPKPFNATWTDEQWGAIYEEGKNILVSAGAGSGKTAVLTERVIQKLQRGVSINQLLILTFTKAAATEMADRIRKKIKKIPSLKEQLNLLDSSYITTFDSFALSIVKRYHYLLNLSPNINIISSSLIAIKKDELMDELFLEYYEKNDFKFRNLIASFCTKDDMSLRASIIKISNQLDQLSDKDTYLETYVDTHFTREKLTLDTVKYTNLIMGKITQIKHNIEILESIDYEFASKVNSALINLLSATTYDDIGKNLNVKLPMAPRGSSEELKDVKQDISNLIKEIKALAIYEDTNSMINFLLKTKPYLEIIIEIIREFTIRLNNYKRENNCYEFNDIAIFAIKIVKENEEVALELRNSFQEIMIDEYQDTNDLQEEFISLISDNNVYMVGDIKQSIYRFRNANPYLFKDKYDLYARGKGGQKIDLNKNFRSRQEVINNINTIFTSIMTDGIGGANYLESHQMIFGNTSYLKEDTNHDNNLELYKYQFDKELGFTKEEIEAFIIAWDIREKVATNYLVFDKDDGNLRPLTYQDIAIIMDRATTFDLYKKIFNYFQIPLTLLKDEKMNDEDDIHVICNLIRYLLKIKKQEFDTEFRYLYTSLMRSFLYQRSDEEIFNTFVTNDFKNTSLYQKCLPLVSILDVITPEELLDKIIVEFSYYEAYIRVGNIQNGLVKIDKLKEMAKNLGELGYDVEEFSNYLVKLLDIGYTIDYKVPLQSTNSVKLMTIHKSKGLEYPLCYFSGLYKEFNISDLKEKFLMDKKYGLIVPFFEEGVGETIYKELVKENYLQEEISEKIRLFYVALTRAREKIIMISPLEGDKFVETKALVLGDELKKNYRSFKDILDSIKMNLYGYEKMISLDKLNLTKDYALTNKKNYRESIQVVETKLRVEELMVRESVNKNKQTFSKQNNKLISEDEYEVMKLGTTIHECLEYMDLKNPNYDIIESDYIRAIIKNFLSSTLLDNVREAKIYQEYEFIYEEENTEYHGIIDLMLEYRDHIDIIDYKLKNIDDFAYVKQLEGYKRYIQTRSSKEINLYLYSLLNHVFKRVS